MEVEDVIELGSSDDEAEPPTAKKIKPLPNAMVHIPNKIRDFTINHVSCNIKKLPRKLVTKSPNQTPIVSTPQRLSRCLPILTTQSSTRNIKIDKTLQLQTRPIIYPVKLLPRKPLKVGNWNSGVQRPRLPGISPKLISSLPPSITIKKTHGESSTPRVGVLKNKIRVKDLENNKFGHFKHKTNPGSCLGDILTVELDDDENASVDNSSPAQWYMRPEEQLEKNKLEEQNTSEPKGKEMIEITIEDSPVKPTFISQVKNVNDTLTITIEDSPVKAINKPENQPDLGSDTEQDKSKSPLSKKKLNYPEAENSNEVLMADNGNATESESKVIIDRDKIALANAINVETNNTPVTSTADLEQVSNTYQKDVSPKKGDLVGNSTEVEKNYSTNKDMNVSNETKGEFHSTFQKFIDLCLEIDKSEDMKTIVEKRIKTYSKQVPKEFVESEQFLDMVSVKITLIKSESSKIYLHIKDVVDELKLHRKRQKPTPLVTENNPIEDVKDDNKYESKRRSQIRKLEKTLKKLEKAINKLDEQEVDFDDEEDSVYLLNDRYKDRFMRTYEKLCQLNNKKMLTEPRIVIECRPGQPPGPAKILEKWINKKVPIGSTLPFPDFHDVIKCVREANTKDKLGWNEADIMDEARDLFTRCGKKLQRRRQENEWRLAASRISQDIDPAENDDTLRKKLDENKLKASKNETELLNKFVQKQNQLHLEPTEIDEKDADNSPVESDDEIDEDSDLLEDSQNRKDRLQRLIDEKESKKKITNNKEQREGLENKNGSKIESFSLRCENETETTNVKDQNVIDMEKSKQIEEKMETKNDLETNSVKKDNMDTSVECAGDVIKKDMCVEIIDDFNKEQMLSENGQEIESDESVEELDVSSKTTVANLETNLNEEENIHLICDDFYGDELNLLEKLNSGNESSSPDSSDVDDTTIAISDSFDSDSEPEYNEICDVISIGNSSCSESETTEKTEKNENTPMKLDDTVISDNAVTCGLVSNIKPNKATSISINDLSPSESESENMNLVFSEDEDCSKCVNLQDDSLTVGETFVGEVNNTENMSQDVILNTCEGDTISKLQTMATKETVVVEDIQNDVVLKNCDNVNKDGHDNTNNDDIVALKYNANESSPISEKITDEFCSDVNNQCDIYDTNEIETSSNVTDDKKIVDFISNEQQLNEIDSRLVSISDRDCTTKKKEASETQITLEVIEELIVPATEVETTTLIASSEEIYLDASQVSKTKETSNQIITMETDHESKTSEAIENPITLEVIQESSILNKSYEMVLLEGNNEIKEIEESGKQMILVPNRESKILEKSLESVLLEDSMEAETREEIGEPKLFEASQESITLEASGEAMDQSSTEDQKTVAYNEEYVTFDEEVELLTVEVGEESLSEEEPKPSTSGLNKNVSSSNGSLSHTDEKTEALEHTFDVVEMMLHKLFNPNT